MANTDTVAITPVIAANCIPASLSLEPAATILLSTVKCRSPSASHPAISRIWGKEGPRGEIRLHHGVQPSTQDLWRTDDR